MSLALDQATHLSGGPIDHLRRGWGKPAFQGTCGHFWEEAPVTLIGPEGIARRYYSACGLDATITQKRPMFGIGSIPACRQCLRKRPFPTARERLTVVEDGTIPPANHRREL